MSRHRRQAPDPNTQLDQVYASVPDAGCRGLCADSCGSIAMTAIEQRRIADRHAIQLPLMAGWALDESPGPLGTPGGRCPALTRDDRCRVYQDRPLVCRLWGSVEGLPCPWGCSPPGGRMTDAAAARARQRVELISDRNYRDG
jgi:hypothetical protein